MLASLAVQELVLSDVKKREKRYGRATAGRIVVKGPGERHQSGGLYDVNIHRTLPNGREVNIGRTAKTDERHSDLLFAINDALKRARRQLHDHVRRMEGKMKSHEGQAIGTVVRLDPTGEFGVLRSNDGGEIYFHRNSFLGAEFSELAVGSRVVFAEEIGEKGPQATTVKLFGKHGMRL